MLDFRISSVSDPSVTPPLVLTYICSHIRHVVLNTSNIFSCHTLVCNGDCYACSKNKLLDWFHSHEPFPNALENFRPLFTLKAFGPTTHQHFVWWSIRNNNMIGVHNDQSMDRWVARYVDWPLEGKHRWRVSPLFWWTLWFEHAKLLLWVIKLHVWNDPGLDHIFIQLSPVSPTPPSLPGIPARTYVGTLPY